MVTHLARLDSVFSALSDPTRREIIEKLSRRRLTVNEIGAGFKISRPAISKHLKVLEDCGILTREIIGREHYCNVEPQVIRAASSWLQRQERYWNSVLDNLGDYLEKSK